jgi:hypothetical protein
VSKAILFTDILFLATSSITTWAMVEIIVSFFVNVPAQVSAIFSACFEQELIIIDADSKAIQNIFKAIFLMLGRRFVI